MRLRIVLGLVTLLVGCTPGESGEGGGDAGVGGGQAADAGTGGGVAAGGGGGAAAGGGGGAAAGGGSAVGGGGGAGVGGGPAWSAGNPGGCTEALPAEAALVDVSNPTAVVGTGTPASCTEAALRAAVAGGGIITFDCGPDPVTIELHQTLDLPWNRDITIDGRRLVTLDGRDEVRLMRSYSGNWMHSDFTLTLQRLTLTRGKATPTEAIPPAPAPCSQGFNDGEGGALYMRDGNLVVIDSRFIDNHAAQLGPDTGGGALYVLGSKRGALIVSSTFEGNSASNAGAVGGLFCALRIYDSRFEGNLATGRDANNDDASRCDAINNGQHEVGSGGNGGAIYSDGVGVDLFLCGDVVTGNAAGTNAFGGGLFFTSNDMTGDLTFVDTVMTGNTGGHWTQAATGSTTNAGTAVGTNCHALTIRRSTLQGLP